MNTNLPSGIVMFLFTDIENGTRLWKQYPQDVYTAHERFNQILRTAIKWNQGFVFQVVGDTFRVAFHSAGDAAPAAVKSQLELNTENRKNAPIKVRMGIHTGEAEFDTARASGI